MRTITIATERTVAVMAEDSKSWRIAIFTNPMMKAIAATSMVFVYLCAVMIYAEMVNVCVFTARTLWGISAIVGQDLELEVLSPPSENFVLFGVGGGFAESRCRIAVSAENSEAQREPFFNKPVSEFSLAPHQAMLTSSSVNVVERQELKDGLTTDGAFGRVASVMGQRSHSSSGKYLPAICASLFNWNFQLATSDTPFAPSTQPIGRAPHDVEFRFWLYFFTSSASLLTDSGNFSPMLDLVLLPEAFGVCVCADPTVRSESIGMRFFFREIRSRLRLPALRAPLDLDFFLGYACFSHRCSFLHKDGLGERPVPVRAGLGLDYYRAVKPWRQVS